MQQGVLGELFVETCLLGNADKLDLTGCLPVPKELVADVGTARRQLSESFDDLQKPDADKLKAMLFRKQSRLLLVDDDFRVELALLQDLVSADELRLQNNALYAFPIGVEATTPMAVLSKLHALKAGALSKLSSGVSKNRLEMARNIATAFAEGRVPNTTQFNKCSHSVLASPRQRLSRMTRRSSMAMEHWKLCTTWQTQTPR